MIKQFHHSEFRDINALVGIKKSSKQKISLVIPALNEAKTIGNIIDSVFKKLINEICLLDEVIVMDGGSDDDTVNIAQMNGATVVESATVFPGKFNVSGKGISLWKSLFATSGDIIVCIDADISNFEPHFVYGLVAPLIIHSNLSFTKAFYSRPLKMNSEYVDGEGGRVTEILVRPLLAMFYPALAKLHQPLAGEYAFRRKIIEQIPFFSGYGVEVGLLIDVLEKFGLEHIAQVHMDVRHHRNRGIHDLGKMSFGILHDIFKKLTDNDILTINKEVYKTMLSSLNGEFKEYELSEEILPPVATYKKEGI